MNQEKSLGTIVKDLTEDLSTLVRSEVALAKLEIKQSMAAMGAASAMFIVAAFFGLFALAFLLATAALGLVAVGVSPWLATLIVAGLLLIFAGILAFVGKSKLKDFNPVPHQTIENVKTDISTIKGEFGRVRQRS